MSTRYNAFISYKHAPEDNRVADAVHKGLEHFHIPGKIRKKTGIKKIDRIFRDKAELPITSDLSDTIRDALENSDYLIVLCSTNTKESAWVPREIETFLLNHTKRDIFTVLVNGEPRDVIPEVLQFEDRVIVDEDGKEHKTRVPIEPLSCDYRISPRQAKKTELPRLASGLIGCAYDEIMNRHRQYRLRQMTAVFSIALAVLLGFCGYMLYSRNEIHKNYVESLRNQSRYLANESGKLLEKENRITALQLALEALPGSDGDDRPVTAEAIKALTDATLAYEANDGNNIHAAWNYAMPGTVSDFQVSSDGKTIAVRDEGSVVRVWDTTSHKSILSLDSSSEQSHSGKVVGMIFPDDTCFAIWWDKTIICYEIASGNKRWEYSLEDGSFEDGENVMIREGSVIIATSKNEYLELDTGSGEVKNKIEVPRKAGYEDLGIVESKLSPNGRKIAFRGIVGWNDYAYAVLDIDSGDLQISRVSGTKNDTAGNGESAQKMSVNKDVDIGQTVYHKSDSEQTIKDIAWVDDDTVIVASTYIDNTASASYGSMDVIFVDHAKITCAGTNDPTKKNDGLTEKWTADFECNGVMINSDFINLGKNTIAYYSGNVISVYDAVTGKEKYRNNVNDSVIDVSDRDGDGKPAYITENGGYAFPASQGSEEEKAYYVRYFTDELRQVVVNNGVYVRQNLACEVIYYGVSVYDEAWTSFGEDAVLPEMSDQFCMDEKCLTVYSRSTQGPLLSLFGLDGSIKNSQIRLEGESTTLYKLIGIHKDRVYLISGTGQLSLLSVDINNGKTEKKELTDLASGIDSVSSIKNGKIVCINKDNNNESALAVYDIETDKKESIVLPGETGEILRSPVYYDGNNIAGTYAVTDGNKILILDGSGKTKTTINCPGVAPIGITFSNNNWIVLYNDGRLCRYDQGTGDTISEKYISVYHAFEGEAEFQEDEENHLLYIQMDTRTDVIDMESDVEIANIRNCFGHHPGRDIFVTSSGSSAEKKQVGYYKRYSVRELMEKARDILQDEKIPEDVKSQYGLE